MSRIQRENIDKMLRQAPSPSTTGSIDSMRDAFAALMATFSVPEGIGTSETTLGGRPVVRVDAVRDQRPGTILYFHGGSFIMGSPQTALGLTANLVVRTGMSAMSLAYRLAPENPFPAANDDCVAAYAELLDAGVDPASIVFAGDSAGGGLAVTAALAARSAGLPLPAGIVCFSGGFDRTRTGASIVSKNGVDPFLTPEGLERTGALYLDGQDPRQPLLAPAVFGDFAGLPPILLQVGTNELLLDDSVRLAERAREAEVDVILDITSGVPHVFQSFYDRLEEADQALDRAALFIRQHVAA